MLVRWATPLTKKAAANAVDFFFPPLCVVCDRRRAPATVWLCDDCLQALRGNNAARDGCPRCGQNRRYRTCACDYAWDQPFERAVSLFDYDDTVQRIVHNVKYQGRKSLAFDMGRLFSDLLPADYAGADAVWIPVPLHFMRRMKRGYNQAEYFARGLLAGSGCPELLRTDVLARRRSTGTQTKLDKSERIENLTNAFTVPRRGKETIRGRDAVLVDDVVTTGATAASCTGALLAAGCRSVRVVSMARD